MQEGLAEDKNKKRKRDREGSSNNRPEIPNRGVGGPPPTPPFLNFLVGGGGGGAGGIRHALPPFRGQVQLILQ